MSRLPFAARFLSFSLCCALIGIADPIVAGEVQGPSATDELTTRAVMGLLQRKHLLKREIDNEMAGHALDDFIAGLDPDKEYFTKPDVQEFNRGRRSLAADLKKGDVSLAFKIYRRYQQRLEQLSPVWAELLAPGVRYDFTEDESFILNSDALDYPKDAKEMKERWRLKMKYNLLAMKTGERSGEFNLTESCKKLRLRYEKFVQRVGRTKSDFVLESFLQNVTRRFDHNSQYMSPTTIKEFNIQLAGNFSGVGIQWKDDDDGFVVTSIIAGGPVEKDGRLKAGDRIVSVGQGEDGEMVDLTNMALNDAVALVRGSAGTVVRLGVVPRGEKNVRTYAIRRGRIVTSDGEIKDRVFEIAASAGGIRRKVGYIYLPTFYRNSTEDVRKLLAGFTAQGVEVVVLDLRWNGGGGLNEAISLTSLFVDQGPIVQIKDNGVSVQQYKNSAAKMTWDKPLVVLTSKRTASGAEILCGAVQDYGRGLIVGSESTYGLGTIQQLCNVSEELFKIDNAPNLGMLKLTYAQFYRINGDSTQKRGVSADVILPSPGSVPAVEGTSTAAAIGFDRVAAVARTNQGMLNAEMLRSIRVRSLARRQRSDDFVKLAQSLEQEQSRRRQLLISLNERKFLEQRKEWGSPAQAEGKPAERDFYLNEALAVTADYANVLRGKTAFAETKMAAIPPPPPAPAAKTPTPAPAVPRTVVLKPDRGAMRRNVEVQILDVERAIERSRDQVAKYEKESLEWSRVIQQGNEAMRRADTNGKKFLVGAAQGFALSKQIEAERNKRFAASALNASRDRLVQLRQELIRLQD